MVDDCQRVREQIGEARVIRDENISISRLTRVRHNLLGSDYQYRTLMQSARYFAAHPVEISWEIDSKAPQCKHQRRWAGAEEVVQLR